MVSRIYACHSSYGMGDLEHLIDLASANEALLDEQFKKDNPATYVVYGPDEQIAMIKNKLQGLDPTHPMHISKQDQTLRIYSGNKVPDDISRDAIKFRVSWSSGNDFALGIENLQFAY